MCLSGQAALKACRKQQEESGNCRFIAQAHRLLLVVWPCQSGAASWFFSLHFTEVLTAVRGTYLIVSGPRDDLPQRPTTGITLRITTARNSDLPPFLENVPPCQTIGVYTRNRSGCQS